MMDINYKNKLIVKSNNLIESKYHLSVREQKFIIFLASLVDRDTMHLNQTTIKIKEVEAALKGSNDKKWGSVYEVVREVVHNIHSKPLDIRRPDGGWTMISWFTRVDADPGKGTITFEFTNDIKKQLLQLNEYFTRYRFGNVLSLKSGYSIRIYELLKLNQYKGKAQYELSHFRELIGVSYKNENGKWLHKYEEYKIFKNRVLKHAQKELKRETDIYFELKEEREGRRVKYLIFYMFKNYENKRDGQKELFEEPQSLEVNDINYPYSKSVIESFVKIGFQEEQAKKIYREGFNTIDQEQIRKEIVSKGRSLDEYLLEKIDYTNHMILKGNVLNPQGLLLNAIKQNYKSKELEKDKKLKEARKKRLEEERHKEEQEARLVQMNKNINQKENQIIERFIHSSDNFLEEAFKDDHPDRWVGYDNTKTIKENYLSSGTALRAKFNAKIKNRFSHKFDALKPEYLALEKFKKELATL